MGRQCPWETLSPQVGQLAAFDPAVWSISSLSSHPRRRLKAQNHIVEEAESPGENTKEKSKFEEGRML